MTEEYNEYGDIKPVKLPPEEKHWIHITKDMFDSDCPQCQKDKKKIKTYWTEGV